MDKKDDPTWLDAYDTDKGWKTGKTDKPAGSSWKTGQRCFHTHPALPIGKHVVYGGSCSSPVYDDCDIYVGLDYSMAEHAERLPWVAGHAIHYKIQDMHAPDKPSEFKALIRWLAERIEKGDKVHIGCVGGHGRTGILLSALVAVMTSEKDAIGYVREHYCKKAVESMKQVKFLMEHFGVAEAKGAKSGFQQKDSNDNVTPMRNEIAPIKARFCLWGDEIKPERS